MGAGGIAGSAGGKGELSLRDLTVCARTRLQTDQVLTFSFIPVTIPNSVEDYDSAPARYWSICLGSAANTRSYYSIYDREAVTADGAMTSFAVCLKNNPRLNEIRSKITALNEAGGHWNLFVWDRDKLDVDGCAIGDVICLMYRNILPYNTWEHSMTRMTPTAYGNENSEIMDHITNPDMQIASKALGAYGPQGLKITTAEFIAM